jgi:hypothetical protein
MVETISETSEIAIERLAPVAPSNRTSCSSPFKYYIHDGIDAFRFQLVGELTESHVAELSGCWRTAKTTLRERKLILDLRGLKALDEAGAKWVTSMAAEGAEYVPRELFQNGLYVPPASDAALAENTRKPGRFGILSTIFRILGPSSSESSTQAQ